VGLQQAHFRVARSPDSRSPQEGVGNQSLVAPVGGSSHLAIFRRI